MKRVLTLLLVLMWTTSVWGVDHGIVNNSGSDGADSLSIPFFALDSSGNMIAMASGDSVFLNVFYPTGALAYRDSVAFNGTPITAQTVSDYTEYTWKTLVSTLDGTATDGCYSYILVVNDQTSATLATPHKGTFWLLAALDLEDGLVAKTLDEVWEADTSTMSAAQGIGTVLKDATDLTIANMAAAIDSINAILDTLQLQDGWVAQEAGEIGDILDTLQNHDDWVAVAANLTLAIDSINAILDSLQLYDAWVATLANQTLVIDTVNGIMDSLQVYDDWIAQESGYIKDVLDTLDLQDDWVAAAAALTNAIDSINAILDTLQNFPARVDLIWDEDSTGHWTSPNMAFVSGQTGASQAVIDTVNAILDTLQLYDVSGHLPVNVTQISGVAAAADNLEEAYDGDATGHGLINGFTAAAIDLIWEADTSTISGAQAVGTMLKDTSAYQGGAAGITDESVAHAVLGHVDSAWAADTPGDMLGDIQDAQFTVDNIWDEDTTGHNTTKSFGIMIKDTSAYQGGAAGITDESVAHAILGHVDTAWAADTPGDLIGDIDDYTDGDGSDGIDADIKVVIDTVNATLDTLQLYDDWIATAVALTNAIDSINAIIDSLQNHDDWVAQEAGEIADILDSLQLQDDWISTAAELTNAIDSINAILDTLQNQTAHTTADAKAVADTLTNRGVTLGSGANTACTLVVYDTDNTVAVADLQIRIDNSSGAAAALGYTNANGLQVFRLIDGTYNVYIPSNSGYDQTTNPEVITYTSNGTDTIEVTPFDPGAPTAGGTYNLYGYIKDVTGTAVSGAIVAAEIPQVFWPTTYSGTLITPFKRADTTDANGLWSLALYQYSVVTVPSTLTDSLYYIITATEPSSGGIIGGEIFSIGYYMPTGANHELSFGGAYEKDLDE